MSTSEGGVITQAISISDEYCICYEGSREQGVGSRDLTFDF
ncbi:hypothetical protein [Scytonema millei]|nr:hypothetical protein [Scytonema millei]